MQGMQNQTVYADGLKTTTEDPAMTDSNTGDASAKPIADGGTEEIRDSNEVRNSNDDVRYYSADGYLYAYREDDEHVVVSRGNEPYMRWTKRVPAERGAVLPGEHLWTIPENWRHRARIKGAGESRYAVYHVPETDVDVLVTVPRKNRLVDAWYGVKRVGTLNVTYDGGVAWDKLGTTIETAREIEEISADVVEALETLRRDGRRFERQFTESVNLDAEEALFGYYEGVVTVRQWTASPWEKGVEISHLVKRYLDVDLDRETRRTFIELLFEEEILPYYPIVDVDVEEDDSIPERYEIRALIEAGVSGVETIDYLITEYNAQMTQSDWAEIRGEELSVIDKNVIDAKRKLSD